MISIRRFPEGWLMMSLIALILLASPSFASSKSSLRYSVFVEKFENKSESPDRLGDEWATQLTSALHESGHFIVVAQDDMQKSALKEQGRGAAGVTAQGRKTAARSRMTPAQLLVKGVITHFKQNSANQGGGFGVGNIKLKMGRKKTELRATIQMIDATTGALVASKNITGVAQDRDFGVGYSGQKGGGEAGGGEDDNVHAAMEKALQDVIPWMVDQLPSVPWRGSVVLVKGEQVIINRGTREGVAAGNEFIAGESELLSDPDTGETLDEIVHERARIQVITANERTSVCKVVGGDLGQIVEGMGIQPGNGKG
jgi:curli biogenesis system outer membrane secretion channel CsgG